MKTFKSLYILTVAFLFFGTKNPVASEVKCTERWRDKLFDRAFGLWISEDEFLTSLLSPDYFLPWRRLASLTKDLGSTIKMDNTQFQVNLDVQHFAPNEISVRTVNGFVVIEAKHEEKQDYLGFVSRQFVRRYSLPQGTESEDVTSQLSSDGILTISVPRKDKPGKSNRIVPITITGPVRKESKESESQDDGTCQSDKCEKH